MSRVSAGFSHAIPLGTPGELNLYNYADSNPTTYADPSGLVVGALLATPIIIDTVTIGYTVGIPAAIGLGTYLGNEVSELVSEATLPSVHDVVRGLPHHAGSQRAELEYWGRPWDDASISKPGDLNMASTNNSGNPCPGQCSKSKRLPNQLEPLDDAVGPHSTSRKGADGRIKDYEVYEKKTHWKIRPSQEISRTG